MGSTPYHLPLSPLCKSNWTERCNKADCNRLTSLAKFCIKSASTSGIGPVKLSPKSKSEKLAELVELAEDLRVLNDVIRLIPSRKLCDIIANQLWMDRI